MAISAPGVVVVSAAAAAAGTAVLAAAAVLVESMLAGSAVLVASVLAVFAIATALAFHSALGDQNQFIHFFKNVAIAGGLLNVIALGGGAWSLDARR